MRSVLLYCYRKYFKPRLTEDCSFLLCLSATVFALQDPGVKPVPYPVAIAGSTVPTTSVTAFFQVFELKDTPELHHCCASVVNKLPHLADRLPAGPGEGMPGQGVPGQGVPGSSVERVGRVAHGLALRGTETFLPWMERLLHFLDSDDTGENMTFIIAFRLSFERCRLSTLQLVSAKQCCGTCGGA
jgi:hypothetical protein